MCADIDKLMIKYPSCSSDTEQKKKIDDLVKEQHIKKGFFDTKVSEYVKAVDLSSKEVASVLSVPRTLRSHTSGRSRRSNSHHSSSSSSTSNTLKARLLAKEEAARLKLEHVKERQCLDREARENLRRYKEEEAERKRMWEEEEMERKRKWQEETKESKRRLQEEADAIKKNIELLQAKQQLEEARLERQVIREELDHGGYLDSDDEVSIELIDSEMQPAVSQVNFPPLQVEQINVTSIIHAPEVSPSFSNGQQIDCLHEPD